jgi:molecular chaperone DnaK
LGKFVLDGIPPAPRGMPQVEVTFDLDANGILNVKALDKATNKTQHITITGSSGLSQEEIKKMQEEAKLYEEEDRKKKESIETRNNAETLVAQSERTLKDLGDKVPADVKTPVEEKIQAVKDVLAKKEATLEEIKTTADALGEEIQKVGAAMYKDTGQSAPEEGVNVKDMNEEKPAEENVVDAEVVDEKKEKEE